jgi:hypothetical protein
MRPWSYSRKSTYEDCPKQFWFSYVEGIPSFRPPSPAASRGTDIHQKAEDYLNGKMAIYPKELQKVAGHAMKLKSLGAKPEGKTCVNQKWEIVEWDDPLGYYRGVLDVMYTQNDGKDVHIEDWKTGQIYDSHPKQMEEYVSIGAAIYPKAERYITRLIYIDQGIVTPEKITLAERIRPIRLLLDAGIENAETDTIFEERPAPKKCDWCNYAKKYGGPCKY